MHPDDQDPDLKRLRTPRDEVEDETPNIDTTVTEEDLALLNTESETLDGDDIIITSERILRQSLGGAILAISKLARASKNDKIKLDAAKYIIDRNLGPLAQVNPVGGKKNPLEELLGDVVSD